MNKSHYMKDTKKFWQARNESRVALDKKRTQTSFSQKTKVAEKLHSDAKFLRSGVSGSSKK